MRTPLIAFLLLLADVIEGLTHNIQLSEEDKLIKTLLARYRRRGKYGRPVSHYNETITINYNMQLIQILDLDERNQVLTLNVWDRYIWQDMHMKWSPKEHGGVKKIRVPPSKIWIPDIKLYNYADTRLAEKRDALCVISHTGQVLWMPQAIYKSSCVIDVVTFPFDVQECKLKFGSWTYDGNLVDLKILINDTGHDEGEIDIGEYVKSNSWEILGHPAKRNVELYTCCPNQPFIDLSFTIIFQRRATFYNYILILPCVLLTSLTLVLFWIPPESPAKLMLGINIFVAFFLLLLLMEANLPPSAAKVPLLGTYYCLNMVLITLSSFLNAFVVNLSFFGARRPLPHCMRMVMFEFFAKILCMDSLVRPFRDKTISELTSRLCADRMPFLGMNLNGDNSSKWNKSDGRSSSAEGLLTAQGEPDQHFAQLNLINYQLGELMEFIKSYKGRITEKDRKDRVAREWKAVSLIFDRIFFLIYLTTIITSLCVVLPIITEPEIPGLGKS
ncbi:neuronal acetylcholine receptor subunit alpha-10 [Aplysia californica]|uniref:Neuronal acetylcholine receptor subunit alpha-10 n=1 Tax=Aplysia californica TaxID=6500 RepID=A0ABM0JIY0_APLCA|nr:neuronal acetylcholine receptor subunit alpha-10 [Aplysia californica]XP_012935917.1 neuronal acetylcholine receptor subunit alpha-10 [Aplysia californica]